MKKRKPRAKKAVKPAGRTARRVIRATAKAPRAMRKAPKRKTALGKTTRKAGTRLRAKPGVATRASSARKRVARRRELISTSPMESEPLRLSAAPSPDPNAVAAQSAEAEPPELADAGAATTPSVKRSAALARKKPEPAEPTLGIPAILLEGDELRWPGMGPGEKFALGPTPAAGPRGREAAELPEAYGTGRLMVVARDPHWLYAHWDLMPQQQRRYNALSADRHLVVRVQPGTVGGHPFTEVHVHPESRFWFIHVERAATSYSAELGYYPANREWVTVASSVPVVTPPDTVSRDKTLRFATIPPEVPLSKLAASGKTTRPAEPPPLEAVQGRVLADVIQRYRIPQEPANSLAIADLIRGPVEGEIPFPPLDHGPMQGEIAFPPLEFPTPLGGPIETISSPLGGEAQPPKGFWLNLNAELIVYGATEPDATVTIGGKPIALRPDGTFSSRFSLPDGDYALTVSARSAEGDCREAALKFSRRTERQGEVGTAPQDPSLNPPPAEIS